MLLESLDPESITTMAVSGLLLVGATLFGIMKLKDVGSNLIDVTVDTISDKLNGKNKYSNVMKN